MTAIFLVKVSGCEAETGEWFSCCSPLDRRSWASAKRDLCENFAGSANFGKLLHDAISYNSEKCSTYGFCGRMKLQKFNVLRVPFIQGHLVSLICCGIKHDALQARPCPISAFVALPVKIYF
jgi:hypothetical protein